MSFPDEWNKQLVLPEIGGPNYEFLWFIMFLPPKRVFLLVFRHTHRWVIKNTTTVYYSLQQGNQQQGHLLTKCIMILIVGYYFHYWWLMVWLVAHVFFNHSWFSDPWIILVCSVISFMFSFLRTDCFFLVGYCRGPHIPLMKQNKSQSGTMLYRVCSMFFCIFFQPNCPIFSIASSICSVFVPRFWVRRDGAAPAMVDGADRSARGDQEHGQLDSQGVGVPLGGIWCFSNWRLGVPCDGGVTSRKGNMEDTRIPSLPPHGRYPQDPPGKKWSLPYIRISQVMAIWIIIFSTMGLWVFPKFERKPEGTPKMVPRNYQAALTSYNSHSLQTYHTYPLSSGPAWCRCSLLSSKLA